MAPTETADVRDLDLCWWTYSYNRPTPSKRQALRRASPLGQEGGPMPPRHWARSLWHGVGPTAPRQKWGCPRWRRDWAASRRSPRPRRWRRRQTCCGDLVTQLVRSMEVRPERHTISVVAESLRQRCCAQVRRWISLANRLAVNALIGPTNLMLLSRPCPATATSAYELAPRRRNVTPVTSFSGTDSSTRLKMPRPNRIRLSVTIAVSRLRHNSYSPSVITYLGSVAKRDGFAAVTTSSSGSRDPRATAFA